MELIEYFYNTLQVADAVITDVGILKSVIT